MSNELRYILFVILTLFMLQIATESHEYGKPSNYGMDEYFIKNAQKEAAANNVVTSIVFDYRGFDTLGEATVMFTAIVGVVMLMRIENIEEGWSNG